MSTHKLKANEILDDLEKHNKDVTEDIEIAKVYAILDLADAIRNKN